MLTARLVAAGCEYFTDEVVLLERGTDRIRPVPVSLCIKDSDIDLLAPHFPGLPNCRCMTARAGTSRPYLPPPPGCSPEEGRSETVALLVFRRYVEGAA